MPCLGNLLDFPGTAFTKGPVRPTSFSTVSVTIWASTGSDESMERYNRVIGELVASPKATAAKAASDCIHGITVVEVLAAYNKHAEAYYQKNGAPTGQLPIVKAAFRPV